MSSYKPSPISNSYDAPDGLDIILYLPGDLKSEKSPCLTSEPSAASNANAPYSPIYTVSSVSALTILNLVSSPDVTTTVLASSGL